MTNIIIPNTDTFDFDKLRLLPATGIQGGAYFTKFDYDNKPLYIQTCKTYSKQGLVKSGKRYFCDLMFDTTNEDIITWFEEFENKCCDLMYEKKERWFQGSITKEDIENTFTPTLRVYKSGKYYLVRVNIKTNTSNELEFKLYDEEHNSLGKDVFTNESKIISILEISGIKFTQQKFQIEIILKQSMIINDEIIFDDCLIQTGVKRKIEEKTSEIDETQDLNSNLENVVNLENNTVQQELNEDNEDNDSLTEIEPSIDIDDTSIYENKSIKIKEANEVYYEMYKKARLEAKEAKIKAQHAYLEAKQIKDLHLLDVSDSDSDSDSDINNLSYYK